MRRDRRAHAYLVASCLVVSSALGAGRAGAEATPEERALATTLFKDAQALLEDGKVAEACRKLEESQRIDPAGGTLLNLAVCHEKEGKTATAWAEFREARILAERAQRDDRIALADERMAVLEPKLSKLVIRIAPSADVPDMDVTADEHAVNRPVWGTAMPVDPGEHVIAAGAPGKKRWTAKVTILPDADVQTIEVPAFEDETPVPAPAPVVAIPVAPVVAEQPSPPSSAPRFRTSAIIAGGVGIAGVVVGSYFGVRAFSKRGQSDDACVTNPCSAASSALNDSAKNAADISTVAFAVGLAGLGLGTYLWFSGDSAPNATRTVRVVPAVGPGRGTLDSTGTF